MPDLTPDLTAEAARVAPGFQVPPDIHGEDFIFWYIHDGLGIADKLQVVREYFQSGQDTMNFFLSLYREYRLQQLLELRPRPDRPVSILEFASGYGRVSRHFPVMLPQARLVACDVHESAVNFLRGIGLEAAQAAHDPDHFRLDERFDVIFAYSFFTHMPRSTWTKWLAALAAHLNPNGLLIFTAHGEASQVLMGVPEIEPDGFFFHSVSEQKDLPVEEYGNTVTSFEFVSRQAHTVPGLKLTLYRQCGAGHHDVYVYRNDPDAVDYDAAPAREQAQREAAHRRMAEMVDALHNSTSWRLTAPIRALSRLLSGR